MVARAISAISVLSTLLLFVSSGRGAVLEVALPGDGLPLSVELGPASVTVDSVTVVATGTTVFGDHECFVCGYPPGPISDWTCWGTNRWVVHTGLMVRVGAIGHGMCYFRDITLPQPGSFTLSTSALECDGQCTPFVISSGVALIQVHVGELAYGDVGCFGESTDSGVWVHEMGAITFAPDSVVRVYYTGSVPAEPTSWGSAKAVYR